MNARFQFSENPGYFSENEDLQSGEQEEHHPWVPAGTGAGASPAAVSPSAVRLPGRSFRRPADWGDGHRDELLRHFAAAAPRRRHLGGRGERKQSFWPFAVALRRRRRVLLLRLLQLREEDVGEEDGETTRNEESSETYRHSSAALTERLREKEGGERVSE